MENTSCNRSISTAMSAKNSDCRQDVRTDHSTSPRKHLLESIEQDRQSLPSGSMVSSPTLSRAAGPLSCTESYDSIRCREEKASRSEELAAQTPLFGHPGSLRLNHAPESPISQNSCKDMRNGIFVCCQVWVHLIFIGMA